MVPTSSIILMALNALLGIAIPIALAWYLVRKHHARLSTILIGAGTFIVFALMLESIMHQVVLKGPHGGAIMGNTLWYAIYGGLAAGIFEETGRFLSMKFLPPLKTRPFSIAAKPVESREARPKSTVCLTSQRHPEKLPKVTGRSRRNPGFPAATRERP